MSENEKWLYEEVKRDEKVELSQPKGIVPLKGDYTYRFAGGREEVVDLSRVGVPGLCCPHIRDVPGAAVLKLCELQPVTFTTRAGQTRSYAQCGPLGYINRWKTCPYREALCKEENVRSVG